MNDKAIVACFAAFWIALLLQGCSRIDSEIERVDPPVESVAPVPDPVVIEEPAPQKASVEEPAGVEASSQEPSEPTSVDTESATKEPTQGDSLCRELEEMKPCSEAEAMPTIVAKCPDRKKIAIVVDDDSETRAEGKWEWLQTNAVGVSSEVCDSASVEQPLARDLPGICETIQRMGGRTAYQYLVSCTPVQSRAAAQSVGSNRAITPATKALERVREKLLSDTWSVVMFAFDNVIDAVGADSSPMTAFINEVGQCVIDGLHVQVVAHPQTYKYVYVLSRVEYSAYANDLAEAIARKMPTYLTRKPGARKSGHLDGSEQIPTEGPEPMVFALTPTKLLEPGARLSVANLEVQRLSASVIRKDSNNIYGEWSWDFRQGRSGISSERVANLDISSWLDSRQPSRATWGALWNANVHDWAELSGVGASLSPPVVVANTDLSAKLKEIVGSRNTECDDRCQLKLKAEAVIARPGVATRKWTDCNSVKSSDLVRIYNSQGAKTDVPGGCTNPQSHLFQSLIADQDESTGGMLLSLFRSPDPGLNWVYHIGEPFESTKLCSQDDRGMFVYSLKNQSVKDLLSVALVSPGLEVSRCAYRLLATVTGSHSWDLQDSLTHMRMVEPDIETICSKDPLKGLVDAFAKTKDKRFPQRKKGHPGGTNYRCGIETMAAVIVEVGKIISGPEDIQVGTTTKKNPWHEVSQECLLKGFQVLYKCH